MAKLNSETLAGVGLLDASVRATPSTSGVIEAAPAQSGGPVQAGRESDMAATEPAATEPVLGGTTQPGLGVSVPGLAPAPSSPLRSGTQVRVSTQNGSSVRPAPPQTGADVAQPLTATLQPLAAPGAVATDIDVYTSAPLGTLPVGTRLPQTLLDSARTSPTQTSQAPSSWARSSPAVLGSAVSSPTVLGSAVLGSAVSGPTVSSPAPPARLRGFATMPPVTPKVLTLDDGMVRGHAPDPVASEGEAAPAEFPAPRFDQTLAFGTTAPTPSATRNTSAPRDVLATTPSPVTPRAKRPLATATSETATSESTNVPRAPSSTLSSERRSGDVTPPPGPIAILRTTEETFRPSAHTTPPGLPELRKGPRYWWALAALPIAASVTLVTYKLESTSVAHGVVVLEGGTTTVVNQVPGPVVQVFVKPGDTVAAGQSLAEIDPSTLARHREELQARQAALLAEQARVTTLGTKWHNAATDALQRKRGLLWQRLKLRGGAPDSAAKEASSADRDAVLLIRQELADVEFELNRRESDRDDQQRAWEHRMNEVRTALSRVNDTSTSVRAPVAGRVEALLATPGQVLTVGSPVAQLVPEGAATQLVVLVPPRVAATLDIGSELAVTLPLAEPTTLPARVTRIADDNVSPDEAASLLHVPQLEPLVRVDVELAAPESVPNWASALRPGQRISALVSDEKRPLWRHLISKFP